jgi:hypothetical protein
MQVLYDPFFQQRSLNQLLNSMYQFAAFKQRQKEKEEGIKLKIDLSDRYQKQPTWTPTGEKVGSLETVSPDSPSITTPGGTKYWKKQEKSQPLIQPFEVEGQRFYATPTADGGITVKQWPKESTPAMIQQYEYARSQGYDKDFVTFKNETAKAGATQINIVDKLAQKKAETTIVSEVKRDFKVKSPTFNSDISKATADKYGDDWEDMPTDVRDEAIFKEMDSAIKSEYSTENVQFGLYTINGRKVEGWWAISDDKKPRLIKRYENTYTRSLRGGYR